MRSRRVQLAVGVLVAALWMAPTAFADATITSAGPLTSVSITSDLNCSVNHTGDTAGEFFGDTACGTFVRSGGNDYGPADVPAGNAGSPAYTPVSQTPVTGSGTAGDPYKIVTVVDLGTSNLRLTETDTYVVGSESYQTDVSIHNSGGSSVDAIIYRAADCYLQDSDSGFGSVDAATGAVACVNSVPDGAGGTMPGTRIEQWYPLSPGSSYYESDFSAVWAATVSGSAFPNTCDCATDQDNGAGLSWSVTIPAGQSVTRSNLITFSPLGHQPLATTKAADSGSVGQGGSDGYTITISNPNTSSVSLDTITDTLPAGFSYTNGSSTGATTSNPSINAQTLTWSGPINVPAASGGAAGTVSLHFNVTASTTAGDYFNNAGGSATGFTVVPTGDTAKVTVTAPPETLTVSKGGAGAGTVTSSPAGISCGATCTHDFAGGTMVTLTPTPDSGSAFTGWSGDCTGTGGCTVTMDQARAVTANFGVARTLTVSKSGNGSGGVTSSPAGISCGATCSHDFADGTMVTLTPAATTGSTFAGWSGDCTGTGGCTVTMSQARSVTATFNLVPEQLTVSKSGSGTGTVTSSPAWITCGATCSHSYDFGTMVTLTPAADSGSLFTGWTGACSGTGGCTVTMDQARSVTASFALNRTLSVTRSGSGSGSVSSSPAGISCGGTCTGNFADGTVVTLTPTPATGSAFAGWSGDCTGTGACVVTMDQARSVTATFNLVPETLSIAKAGTGSGSVSSSPAGVDCGGSCSAQFDYGTSVTLNQTPSSGSTFGGWSGACSGTGACTVSMDQARSVTATFNATPPPIGVGGPGSVGSGLFCGAQHRGKCIGLPVKGIFDRPGNARWTFDAFNPTPGHGIGRVKAAAAKRVRLGVIKRQITKAGTVTVVFKMKKGAKTNKLYRQVKKRKLKNILVTLTFTDTGGQTSTKTKTIKLKR